jgi:hypothetical protein
MNTFTIDDIRRLEPCYDPVTGYDQGGRRVHPGGFLPEDWQGTALDILRIDACPAIDRLWLVLRDGWIDDRTLRLFAVWCVRQALALVTTPDPRSVNVCDVAERFANGQATREELRAAGIAAVAAAKEAVMDVAGLPFWVVSWVAARVAASAAAVGAARVAAWDAARVAAVDAAGIAARVAAVEAAVDAAGIAAMEAARVAAGRKQVAQLIAMLESEL